MSRPYPALLLAHQPGDRLFFPRTTNDHPAIIGYVHYVSSILPNSGNAIRAKERPSYRICRVFRAQTEMQANHKYRGDAPVLVVESLQGTDALGAEVWVPALNVDTTNNALLALARYGAGELAIIQGDDDRAQALLAAEK